MASAGRLDAVGPFRHQNMRAEEAFRLAVGHEFDEAARITGCERARHVGERQDSGTDIMSGVAGGGFRQADARCLRVGEHNSRHRRGAMHDSLALIIGLREPNLR